MARKPDEIALYAALRQHAVDHDPGFAVIEIAARLGVPRKRAWLLVEKWSRAGWWDYGVSLRGGWFTDRAPTALDP